MSPVALVKLLASIASVAVAVDQQQDGKQVRVLGIPVWDSRWPGVKRRQARRAARREARQQADHREMLEHVQKVLDKLPNENTPAERPKAKR